MAEVVPGVWAPMDGLSSYDPLQGGYAFCDRTDGGATYHPGSDLNAGNGGDADLGLPLRLPVAGEVVYVQHWDGRSSGYGAHLWALLDSGDYLHYCHCDRITAAGGKRYPAGTEIATVGASGFQTWAHLHFEVRREDPATHGGYGYWPYGQPADYVRAHYVRPADWWNGLLAWAAGEADVAILSGAQQKAVQGAVWGAYWAPEQADFAIPASWRAEWEAGRYPGAPLGPEQALPAAEEKPEGSFQVFQRGCAVWLPGQPVSWEG